MNALHVHRLTPRSYDAVANDLVSVYVDCFAQPPWNEVFQPEVVLEDLRKSIELEDAIFLVAEDANGVLGGTVLYPLRFNEEVADIVGSIRAMYCEELFVASTHHRRGIGGRLFDTATGISMALGYEQRVLRTGVNHERAKRFYASRGYRPVGSMPCRSLKRTHGDVREEFDTRVVMVQGGLLSTTRALG